MSQYEMNISDLDISGKVKWIVCVHCGKKYLMRGGTKHISKCAIRKKADEKKKHDL